MYLHLKVTFLTGISLEKHTSQPYVGLLNTCYKNNLQKSQTDGIKSRLTQSTQQLQSATVLPHNRTKQVQL